MNFDFKSRIVVFFSTRFTFFLYQTLNFLKLPNPIYTIYIPIIFLLLPTPVHFFSALHNQLYCRRTWFQSRGRTFTSASSTYSLIFIFSNVNILIILRHTTYILFIYFHLLMLKNKKKSHFKENKMVSAYLYKQD